MKSLNYYIITVALVFNYACSLKSNIYGSYKHTNKVGSELLIINIDSTFYFKSNIPLVESESRGKWSIKNNNIYFKSFDEFKNDFVLVREFEENNNSSSISFIDENNNSIPKVFLNLNKKWYEADFEGEIKNIVLKKGDSIKVNTILLGSDFDYIIKKDYNSIKVVFKIHPKKNNLIYIDELTKKSNVIKVRGNKFIKL